MNKIIKQAFTLIELLVVIAIIGILSGLIVIAINGTTQKATIAKAQVFSNSLKNSLMLNLISEWKFDEGTGQTTVDNWTKINNCTLGSTTSSDVNDPIWTTSDCVYGSCLLFDGINDYVDCGNDNSVNLTIAVTVSIWIKCTVDPRDYNQTPITKGLSNGATKAYNIYLRSTDDKIYFNASLGSATIAMPTDMNGKWYNIVGTYDKSLSSNQINIYLNGTKGTPGTETADMSILPNNLFIGGNVPGGAFYFNGSIDDVRVYNAAMSISQIREQYYAGLNKLLNNGGITKEEYLSRALDLNNSYSKK